ncbi:alkaline phosphatase family protein, partial [Acidianus sp. RZ1]|uniref:alkaline phosphatase family protein n=1 Tax=Acidianus sp. RZ1 TaxID=1540082 RepID=UPI001492CA47
DYAEEYTLADNYFSPVLSTTQPNRLAYLTGYPTQVESDSLVKCVIPFSNTIMYQLNENGISWGYFDYGYSQGQSYPPFPLIAFLGSLNYRSHYFNTSVFLNDLKGNLPSVSWLMFTGGIGTDTHSALDLHPPFNLTEGQINLSKYINAIMESKYWNSTAIFITFDEGGGFYDQVVPPLIYTNVGYSPFLNKLGIYNHSTLGERVPLLIISPFSKEGWINNYSISGYTLLGFIDYNWKLPWLTPIAENSDVQGILQSFNFSLVRQGVILFPQNWTYPLSLQYPIHYGYVATVKDNYSGYILLNQKGYLSEETLDEILKNTISTTTETNSVIYTTSEETNSSLSASNQQTSGRFSLNFSITNILEGIAIVVAVLLIVSKILRKSVKKG